MAARNVRSGCERLRGRSHLASGEESGVTVHERCVGDVTIIDVDGRITEDGAEALRALVQPLVRQGRVKIVFDLHDAPYIDTTALGVLVRSHASATREGGGLRLLHVTPRVHELLSITRLDSVLDQFDDEAAVVSSFGQV
jgi:anti-sigma B factor antagonist